MKRRSDAYWEQRTHLLRADEYICSRCGFSAGKAYRQCPGCDAWMSDTEYDPSWVEEAEILDMIWEDD